MSNTYIDINSVCRVCLNQGDMMHVFKMNISKKIMACSSTKVWPNDGLPKQICNKCLAKLHISYQFKKLCESSDSKLREFLIKTKEATQTQTNEEILIQSNDASLEAGLNNDCVSIMQSSDNIQPEFIDKIGSENVFDGLVTEFEGGHPQEEEIIAVVGEIEQNIVIQLEEQLPENIDIVETIETQGTNVINTQKHVPNEMECNICGKVLSSKQKLKKHMNLHVKDPPFKCNICFKEIKHQMNYLFHMRIHNDEKPFKCDTCGHECRQQQDLKKHMMTHTGERPHSCHICTRKFASRSNLAAHVRTHTGDRPYVCSVCHKSFCQSSVLTRHMRIHTGEKSHFCDVCEKGFVSAGALTSHRRVHTGERPYACRVCKKTFSHVQTLKPHMKTHCKG